MDISSYQEASLYLSQKGGEIGWIEIPLFYDKIEQKFDLFAIKLLMHSPNTQKEFLTFLNFFYHKLFTIFKIRINIKSLSINPQWLNQQFH